MGFFVAASLGSACAALGCAWLVFTRGLVKIYPAFFAYLISQSILVVSSDIVGPRSGLYAWIYIIGYPLTWVVYCLVVKELYAHIFANYPGIAMFGKWSIYAAVVLAGIGAAASKVLTRESLSQKATILILFESAGRGVVFCLAVLIVMLLLVIARYPLQLHMNVLINCIFFSALLLVEAGGILAEHLTGLRNTIRIDTGFMIFDACCFAVWAMLLSREGETKVVRLRRNFPETDLLRHLDMLNGIVLGSSRR